MNGNGASRLQRYRILTRDGSGEAQCLAALGILPAPERARRSRSQERKNVWHTRG